MAKGCKKCKPTECEECPEWIFTLADLIMCMMGLFVILWVLKPNGSPSAGNSSEQNKEFIKMAAAIRDAFGYVPDPKSFDPIDMELIQQKLKGERVPRGPGEGGKTQLDNKGTEGEDAQVTNIREGKQSTLGTPLLFAAGSAIPSRDVEARVKQIAAQIRGHRQIVIIKGHASLDDAPENMTGQAADREARLLSFARADAISELLMAEGIAPEILRIQGCSTWEPVRQRRFGPDAQAANRRVEVIVTDQLVEERQDRSKPVEPGPTVRPEPGNDRP